MNRKEAKKVAERELVGDKQYINSQIGKLKEETFEEGYNEIYSRAIPLLADKIMEIDKLKEAILGLDYYEQICIPWYQKYCNNSVRLKPLADMIKQKIQKAIGESNES